MWGAEEDLSAGICFRGRGGLTGQRPVSGMAMMQPDALSLCFPDPTGLLMSSLDDPVWGVGLFSLSSTSSSQLLGMPGSG